MIINIPQPCTADWKEMKPVDGCTKHCASCNKDVVDFTAMIDNHLYHYLNQHPGICGRFAAHQLNRDILPYHAPPKSRWTFKGWAIAVGLMFAAPPKVSAQMPAKSELRDIDKKGIIERTLKVEVIKEANSLWPVTIRLTCISENIYDSVSQQQDGKFEFTNIPTGKYHLVASAPDYETRSQAINVTDSITSVTINLKQRLKPLWPELDVRPSYQGAYILHDYTPKKEVQIKKTPWIENTLRRLKAK